MRLMYTLMLFIAFADVYALEDMDRQQLQHRIQPVGKVRLQEQKLTSPSENKIVSEKPAKQEPGQATYERYCITCHKDGLAGAPRFQNAEEWKSRLSGKTIDDLVAVAIKGINAMPPKGTCMECTDAELKAVIQYMLPKS